MSRSHLKIIKAGQNITFGGWRAKTSAMPICRQFHGVFSTTVRVQATPALHRDRRPFTHRLGIVATVDRFADRGRQLQRCVHVPQPFAIAQSSQTITFGSLCRHDFRNAEFPGVSTASSN